MDTKIKTFVLISLFLGSTFVYAQPGSNQQNHTWGLETELVQPFVSTVGIFRLQLSKTILNFKEDSKGDLLLGLYMRPNVSHDVVKTIDEYMFYTAGRYYFWKEFHVEAGVNAGYAWGKENLVDHKDYECIVVFWEANAGYKFNFGDHDQFYILPQIGGIGSIVADIGPRNGKPDNFFGGNLLIGINF